jgi:hypothetical protein
MTDDGRQMTATPIKDLDLVLGGVELHVNHVLDRVAVDGQHFVARAQT